MYSKLHLDQKHTYTYNCTGEASNASSTTHNEALKVLRLQIFTDGTPLKMHDSTGTV